MDFKLLKENFKLIIIEELENTSDNAFSVVNMKTLDVVKTGFESRTLAQKYIENNKLDSDIYKSIKNDFLNSKKELIQNFKNGK